MKKAINPVFVHNDGHWHHAPVTWCGGGADTACGKSNVPGFIVAINTLSELLVVADLRVAIAESSHDAELYRAPLCPLCFPRFATVPAQQRSAARIMDLVAQVPEAAQEAATKPTYEELETNAATQAHINLVRIFLRRAATELLQRGEVHDLSKFSPEEVEAFTEFTPKLKGSTYGSPEYKSFLREMKPALDHHYAANRHHPEHFDDGIEGMNLIDVIEMFIDWLASTKRHADGDINRSIEINAERFAMAPQLVQIFRNTARDFDATPAPQAVK